MEVDLDNIYRYYEDDDDDNDDDDDDNDDDDNNFLKRNFSNFFSKKI